MGIAHSQVGLVVLWLIAGLTTLWILGPMVLFFSPLRAYANDVFDDPREAERPGDPDFERRFVELRALGFVPVGKTRERCRFFTPLHWNRVFNGSRWFASPDRKVFVELHRLAGGHPQRMSANTTFEGGGLLVTSTTPTGTGGEIDERHRRREVGSDSVADLLREHERHLGEFSREAGLRSKAASLSDMAAESAIITKPFVARHRLAGLYAIAAIYLMPLWAVAGSMRRVHQLPLLPPAMLCGVALLFAILRFTVLPEYRRFRWIAYAGLMAMVVGLPLVLQHVRPRHRAAQRPTAPRVEVAPAATSSP